MKEKNPKAIELQKQIERYDNDISDDIADGDTYQMKAGALIELGKVTGNTSYNTKALECYNKAIELGPDNPDYFADRSKLYVAMGANELAIEDIQKVKELPESSNPIAKMYLNNTVKELAKLDSVQSTIKKLQAEGKIDPQLATALEEHAKVTANLVVQVGAHGERLDSHDFAIGSLDARTEELVRIVQALSEGRGIDKTDITRLMQDTGVLKGKVEENTQKIQGIKLQVSQTEKRVEELSKKLETFHNTANELRQKVDDDKKVEQADKAVMHSMISSIKDKIKTLAKQEDVETITAEMAGMMKAGTYTKKKLLALEDQLEEIANAQGSSSSGGGNNVTVNMLSGVTYDNDLLNHPNLLKQAATTSGLPLNRILDMSPSLSEGLVSEAVRSADYELILAGLMSLEGAT